MKKSTLLLFALFISISSFAQIEIKGYVFDEDSCALPGASVFYQNINVANMTGIDGFYSISVYSENTLVYFSAPGMGTLIFPAKEIPKIVYLKELTRKQKRKKRRRRVLYFLNPINIWQ